jgi:UDP-N-acetylglucosamine acyltransferase
MPASKAMEPRIHPTAVIEPGAELGDEVSVGAYAYVGRDVRLGAGCALHHHATVDGATSLGERCEVYPYACLGLRTQDLKFKGGRPGLSVGARNVFREFVTVHSATDDGNFTVIGDDNYFLCYVHVAHDCVLGSHIIASNNATFAGHVKVGDHVVFGGMGGMHQFGRVGEYAMVAAMAKVVQDVPPYMLADGNPAVIRTINKIALDRAGFTPEQVERVKAAYRILYRSGLNRSQALEQLSARHDAESAEIAAFIDFARKSERGFCPAPAD